MIADDMMTFIKSDIVVFGLGVLLFIIATLWYVFRKLIWIIVPISSCFFSVIIMRPHRKNGLKILILSPLIGMIKPGKKILKDLL